MTTRTKAETERAKHKDAAWMLEPADMTPEETGRWLYSRVEAMWDREGKLNHLWRERYGREEAERVYLFAATKGQDSLYCLAFSLALAGDYLRAGILWGQLIGPALMARSGNKIRTLGSRLTKLNKKAVNHARWRETAQRLREEELRLRRWPTDNLSLAKKVSAEAEGSINTIRLLLPTWGLDKDTWRMKRREQYPQPHSDRVKPISRIKHK